MNYYQSEQQNKILKDLFEAGQKNIYEKRKNFEHLTLLIGTILGFSAGLAAMTDGEPNDLLISSWVVDAIAIFIGCLYLILEAESRYFREIILANKRVDLVKMETEEELRKYAQSLFSDANKIYCDVSSGNNPREKFFIAFAKYQRRIEAIFYAVFSLSLVLLVMSFLN